MNSIDRMTTSSFAERISTNRKLVEDLRTTQPQQPEEKPDYSKTLVDTVNISREAAKTIGVTYATPETTNDQKGKERLAAQISNTRLQFEVNSPGQVVVKVVDVDGEVIRQMPPEVALAIANAMKEKARDLTKQSIADQLGYNKEQVESLLSKSTPNVGSTLSVKA